MRDLLGGAVTFTRASIQGGTIPTQKSLDEGRTLLTTALQQVAKVGDDVTAQVNDKDLKQITYALYGKIPKIKPLGAAESQWILSKDNIQTWQQDIDAFETALKAGSPT